MDSHQTIWTAERVSEPGVKLSVPVIVARDLPYQRNPNSLQKLSIYLPATKANSALIGRPSKSLGASARSDYPRVHVHVHGGPVFDAGKTAPAPAPAPAPAIEAHVAHTFSRSERAIFDVIVSIDHAMTHYPAKTAVSGEPVKDEPAKVAAAKTKHSHNNSPPPIRHQHVSDVLHALSFLRTLGLGPTRPYILSGHGTGACIAFQAVLQPPTYWDLPSVDEAPQPAALVGLNGLYDIPGLIRWLVLSRGRMEADTDPRVQKIRRVEDAKWRRVSPACFERDALQGRVAEGMAPGLVYIDHGVHTQHIPIQQADTLEKNLSGVDGLTIVRGECCKGGHSAPMMQGETMEGVMRAVIKALEQKWVEQARVDEELVQRLLYDDVPPEAALLLSE